MHHPWVLACLKIQYIFKKTSDYDLEPRHPTNKLLDTNDTRMWYCVSLISKTRWIR